LRWKRWDVADPTDFDFPNVYSAVLAEDQTFFDKQQEPYSSTRALPN
jgi:hypothetical protein